eukprot:1368117-Rhodomonas_salina.1
MRGERLNCVTFERIRDFRVASCCPVQLCSEKCYRRARVATFCDFLILLSFVTSVSFGDFCRLLAAGMEALKELTRGNARNVQRGLRLCMVR